MASLVMGFLPASSAMYGLRWCGTLQASPLLHQDAGEERKSREQVQLDWEALPLCSPSSGDGSPVSTQDDVGVTVWLQEDYSGWKALVTVHRLRLG